VISTRTERLAVLFTDIVGSTRLWATHYQEMSEDLERHDALVEAAIRSHSGRVFATGGDSFAASFDTCVHAVDAAVSIQLGLGDCSWRVPEGIRVRTAVHVGEVIERDGDYFGPTLNLAARVLSSGHGSQILVTRPVADELARPLRRLGTHRFRDIEQPIEICQVLVAGLQDAFPPIASLDETISTLPQQRSSFVGRLDDLHRLRTQLVGHRLVTVTGTGGTGKTRLAVEAAAADQGSFPGGVFFVDLTSAGDGHTVPAAAAAGIGLSVTRTETVLADISHFLSSREVLLVVDNCEHVLEAAATTVDQLLMRSPGLRVIATSREPLDIEGESVLQLGSLDATEAGLRLFVERATAVNEHFDLNDVSRGHVVELCQRLDGMPLAIELAASRSRSFTPGELLARLDDRFSLLRRSRSRPSRSADRQRTLEASIDWSYELLDEQERFFLRRLGVFAGVFTLEVAAAVAGLTPQDSFDLLDSLVSKSLVVAVPVDAELTGYQLLETVRAYARARLVEEGELDAALESHESAYETWCASRSFLQRREWSYCRSYRAQIADIWVAADHAIDHGRLDHAAAILAAGEYANDGSAHLPEMVKRLTSLWESHRNDLSIDARTLLAGTLAQALMDAGLLAEMIPVLRQGMESVDEADPIARPALLFPNLVVHSLLDPLGADEMVESIVERLPDDGERDTIAAKARVFSAFALGAQRRYDEADQVVRECFTPERRFQNDKACVYHLWLSHLLECEPLPDVVEFGRSLTLDDTPYAISAHVAAAMCSGRSRREVGGSVAGVADRMLSGRLPLEESEVLIAFARLAQLEGDHGRARQLASLVAPRSPWTIQLLSEVLGEIEGWAGPDWMERTTLEMIARAEPSKMLEIRNDAPALLSDELNRWRTG
jgi:predicted ATPase/class 3 adenylate cyclase